MTPTFTDKLSPVPPKKLLALDGGGIRGFITVEVLARLEQILRDSRAGGSPDFRLSDYFDYVAGTSVGAITATFLSLGMKVDEIREAYQTIGLHMFTPARYLQRFRYKYDAGKITAQLKDFLGPETTLGSERLRTLLMMVVRNATTDSPWPVSNNPRAKFNDRNLACCNLDIPLWQLIRASTAAPTYFPPEKVLIGDQEFLFVDGGVSTYNNPAFQLFLMATLKPYGLQWPTGADKMLLVSVGTGTVPDAKASLTPKDMDIFYNVHCVPTALMFAAANEQDVLCRVFGKCLAGPLLDSELGNLIGDEGPGGGKLFTYARLNTELSEQGLRDLGLSGIRAEDVQRMDSVEHVAELREIGRAIAEKSLTGRLFEAF
jgi:Patatin-like phospholipase